MEKKTNFRKSHNAEKLKGGPLGFLNTQSVVKYQRSWRGTLWREKTFRKKGLTMSKNWKGGSFGIFKQPICCKISKKLKGDPLERKKKLEKKVSQCRKTERGTLWGFSTSILSQNIKKLKGGPFGEIFFRESLAVPKKMKGGLCSRPVWYVTRKSRKNFFGSVL